MDKNCITPEACFAVQLDRVTQHHLADFLFSVSSLYKVMCKALKNVMDDFTEPCKVK